MIPYGEPHTVRPVPDASKRPPRRRLAGLALSVVIFGALVTSDCVVPRHMVAQAAGTVAGVVVHGENESVLAGVTVSAFDRSTTTGTDGRFVLDGLPDGPVMLRFSHLGLGDRVEVIVLSPDRGMTLEVRMTDEAIELAPLVVEARSELDERRRVSGHGINEVEEAEIDVAARAGLTLRELLQTTMPGTLAAPSGLSETCVQYRAIRSGGDTGCMEVTVVLDGVQVSNPGYIYETMPLNAISRLEMLSPGQAGVRYGTAAGQAVLLIETRRGPQLRRSIDARFVTGLAWDEPTPYDWSRVIATTFVVNAAGVGTALLLADRCLRSPEAGSLGLRTRCNGFNTAAIGLLSVGVPAFTGAMVARWTGGTDQTRGRVGPSAFAGGVVLSGGYLLMIHGGSEARAAGFVLLSAGVPIAIALADRVFRTIR